MRFADYGGLDRKLEGKSSFEKVLLHPHIAPKQTVENLSHTIHNKLHTCTQAKLIHTYIRNSISGKTGETARYAKGFQQVQ